MPLPAVDISSDTRLVLNGDGRELVCVINTLPILAGLWRLPAVFTYRGRSKGDAFESGDSGIVSGKASYQSILGLDYFQHAEHLM